MNTATRTVVLAAAVALAAFAGVALGAQTTTTTTDGQTNQTATVEFPDQQIDGESVTIDAATLPDGGFAVVTNQDGNTIGHTDYLSSGDHENLTVSLNESVEEPQVLAVTLYRNNGSEAYNATADSVAYQTGTDTPVSDVSFVSFGDRSRSTTETTETTETTDATTDAATETTTEAGTADESSNATDETTEGSSGGIPGFTPITAIAALLAAGFVALRRA